MRKAAPLFEIIYQTAQEEKNDLSVETLCDIAGVSRSGYYAWVAAIADRERREEEDSADFRLILIAYNKRGYTKGARDIYMCLLHMDPPIIMNLKKIRRLMKKYNLQCPVKQENPYRQMQKAIKTSNYADNLLQREFECYGPRMVLLTDITNIPYNGVFAYLSVILDALNLWRLILLGKRQKNLSGIMEWICIRKPLSTVTMPKKVLCRSSMIMCIVTPVNNFFRHSILYLKY